MVRLITFFLFLASLSSPVHAKEVVIAFGMSVPPYIIQRENRGIEFDIIRESLAYSGHTVKPLYIPFDSITNVFVDTNADAAATVEEKIGIDGFYSDHVISYQNYAITLKKNHFTINSLDDLKDKSVSAFQSATRYMGTAFAEMAKTNPRYREKRDQLTHVKLLLNGQVDVVVTDKNIFQYFANQLGNTVDISQPVTYHTIFPPNDYKVIFREQSLRDDFNKGLRHLKESGRYQQFFDAYLTPHPKDH
ncbi:MAG: ABC-type amino acid transport/signal transduction system [Rickettsiales bacterium]|jgi:polar amino acid transport system substrate-binding protein|nr:ABC-type amino acid transport/signal transduction system [Rickettsiales bacterium]